MSERTLWQQKIKFAPGQVKEQSSEKVLFYAFGDFKLFENDLKIELCQSLAVERINEKKLKIVANVSEVYSLVPNVLELKPTIESTPKMVAFLDQCWLREVLLAKIYESEFGGQVHYQQLKSFTDDSDQKLQSLYLPVQTPGYYTNFKGHTVLGSQHYGKARLLN